MKDAISYIRVSSEEQADRGLGLEAQRQRIARSFRWRESTHCGHGPNPHGLHLN